MSNNQNGLNTENEWKSKACDHEFWNVNYVCIMKFSYIIGFISFEVWTMLKPFQLLRQEFPLQVLLAPEVLSWLSLLSWSPQSSLLSQLPWLSLQMASNYSLLVSRTEYCNRPFYPLLLPNGMTLVLTCCYFPFTMCLVMILLLIDLMQFSTLVYI